MLAVDPPLLSATAIDVAEPHVSFPTGTSENASENVVVAPSLNVNSVGATFAFESENLIELEDDGTSIDDDGSTAPVRSWSVSVGQPLTVHDPGVFFMRVTLA